MRTPLAGLLRTYLHQDYDLRYRSVDDAVRAYCDESTERERESVLAEIDLLLAEHRGDASLYAALRARGFVFYPPLDGETTRAWLVRLRALLA